MEIEVGITQNEILVQGVAVLADWIPVDVVRRFFDKVVIDPSGCWLWTAASRSSKGYGAFTWRGMEIAHRFSYMLFRGVRAGKGKHIHHKCSVPACVNPWHLQELTPREHVLGHTPEAITYKRAHATQCPNGHEYGSETRIDPLTGKRRCRVCLREWAKSKRADYRAENPLEPRTQCKFGHPWIPENITIVNPKLGTQRCRLCLGEYQRDYHQQYTGENVRHRKTHCKKGHALTPENVYEFKGKRECRLCRTEYFRARDKRVRESKLAVK